MALTPGSGSGLYNNTPGENIFFRNVYKILLPYYHVEILEERILTKTPEKEVIFREVQDLRRNIFWIFILYPALLFWYFAIQRFVFHKVVGTRAIPDQVLLVLWALFGFFFPFMLYCTKHITEVRKDGIYIRFVPLNRSFKKIPFYVVEECKIQQYEPFEGKASGENSEKETEREAKTRGEAGNEAEIEAGIEEKKEKTRPKIARGAPVVILKLISGKKMLISSRKPEELCRAIREAAAQA